MVIALARLALASSTLGIPVIPDPYDQDEMDESSLSITGYTRVMKTAVSIPDELFAEADSVARRLGVSRSQLYARALEMFLAAQQSDPVTEKLNELADEVEPAAGAAAGRRLIEQDLWQW